MEKDLLTMSTPHIYRELLWTANYSSRSFNKRMIGYIMGELDRRRENDKRILTEMLSLSVNKSRKKISYIKNEHEMIMHILKSNPLYIETLKKNNPVAYNFCIKYMDHKRKSARNILEHLYVDSFNMKNSYIRYEEVSWGNGRVKMPYQIFKKTARMIVKMPEYEERTCSKIGFSNEEQEELTSVDDYMGIRLAWHTGKKLPENKFAEISDKMLKKMTSTYGLKINEVNHENERRKLKLIPRKKSYIRDKISCELVTLNKLFEMNVVPLEEDRNKTRLTYGYKNSVYIDGQRFKLSEKDKKDVDKMVSETLRMLGFDKVKKEQLEKFRYFRELFKVF